MFILLALLVSWLSIEDLEHTGGIESTSVIGNFGIYIQISDSNGIFFSIFEIYEDFEDRFGMGVIFTGDYSDKLLLYFFSILQ